MWHDNTTFITWDFFSPLTSILSLVQHVRINFLHQDKLFTETFRKSQKWDSHLWNLHQVRNKYGFATSVKVMLWLGFFTLAEAEVLSLRQCEYKHKVISKWTLFHLEDLFRNCLDLQRTVRNRITICLNGLISFHAFYTEECLCISDFQQFSD